jgi:hypothetical protein
MNTRMIDRPSEVDEATAADLARAVRTALDRCGLTFDQLRLQAEAGQFDSLDARLAWVAVGDLWGLIEADGAVVRP